MKVQGATQSPLGGEKGALLPEVRLVGKGLIGLRLTTAVNIQNAPTFVSHRHRGVVLVSQEVVNEPRARVAVTADRHSLVHAVRVARDYVVKLVRHTPALRHVGHRPRSVQLKENRGMLRE